MLNLAAIVYRYEICKYLQRFNKRCFDHPILESICRYRLDLNLDATTCLSLPQNKVLSVIIIPSNISDHNEVISMIAVIKFVVVIASLHWKVFHRSFLTILEL